MEVIINPSLEWDCVEHVPLTPKILGGPSHGTFAEYVIIQANNVVQKAILSILETGGSSFIIRFNCL